ncbi:receptor expression-enhancing protein 3 [Drosophila tropicalis]|uniref:receptor expression-enhancing protein 3 n=1 Tax=Drosophila tropicalis TaxID=46794 RepID=UPI0035AB949E
MCFLGILTRFLILINGTLWPAFCTYRSLNKNGVEEFRSWSKYWIVYALLICLEYVVDFFCSWMPLYSPSKLLLVLFMVVPAPKASVWVYDAIVGPLLSTRQQQIDNFLLNGRERIMNDCLAIGIQMINRIREIMMPVLSLLWSKTKATLPWNAEHEKVATGVQQNEPEDSLAPAYGGSLYSSLSNSELSFSDSAVEFDQDEFEVNASMAKTQLQEPMLVKPRPSLVDLAKKSLDMNASNRRSQRKQLRLVRKSLIQAVSENPELEMKFIPDDEFERQLNDDTMEDSTMERQALLRKRVITKIRHRNASQNSEV